MEPATVAGILCRAPGVAGSPVDDPRVHRAWKQLGLTEPDPAIIDELQVLVDELDDKAASLQLELDRTRELGNERGREADLVAKYSEVFAQARAAEALVAALAPNHDDAVEGAL